MSGSSQDRPFLRLGVSAADPADEQRLQTALVEIIGQHRWTVGINPQPKDGNYWIEGQSELDLDSVCDRLRDHYRISINVSPPGVILLETIRKQAIAEGKYVRQIGGSGNYGHCKLLIEPVDFRKGYEFINETTDSSIPTKYLKAIDQGIQDAMRGGILASNAMVSVKVTLFDGSYHEVDSNEMAFKIAGAVAFKEAARKASPVVLEPMMAIDLGIPEGFADLESEMVYAHRGRIEQNRTANGFSEIRAIVPLSELLVSDFLGLVPMSFAGYEPVRADDSSDDGGSAMPANKPNPPRPGRRSEIARRAPEDE